MNVDHVHALARVSVLQDAATLGVLHHPAVRGHVAALIEAKLVVARRPVPDVSPGQRGRWGRLSLTSRGAIELRMATAALAGRSLPMRLRQLSLWDHFDGGSPSAHFDRNGTLP